MKNSKNILLKSVLLGTVVVASTTVLSTTLISTGNVIEDDIAKARTSFDFEMLPTNEDSFIQPLGFNVGSDYISFSVAMKNTSGNKGRDIEYILNNENSIDVSIEKLTDGGEQLQSPELIYTKEFSNPTAYTKSYESDKLTNEQKYFVPVYDFMITNDDIMGRTVDNDRTFDNPLTSEDDLLLVVDKDLPFQATYGNQYVEAGTVFSAGADPLLDEGYYNNELETLPLTGFEQGESYNLVLDYEIDGEYVGNSVNPFAITSNDSGIYIDQRKGQMDMFEPTSINKLMFKGLIGINYDSALNPPINYTEGDSITITNGSDEYGRITSDIEFTPSELTATRDASPYDKDELFGTFNPKDGYKSTNIQGVEANFINTKSDEDYNVLTDDRYREVTKVASTNRKMIEFEKSSGMTQYTPNVSTGAKEDFLRTRNLTLNTTSGGAHNVTSNTVRLPSLYFDFGNPETPVDDIVGFQPYGESDPEGSGGILHQKSDDPYQVWHGYSLFFYAPLDDDVIWYDGMDFNEYWYWSMTSMGKNPGGVAAMQERKSDEDGVLVSGPQYKTFKGDYDHPYDASGEYTGDNGEFQLLPSGTNTEYYAPDSTIGRDSPVYRVGYNNSGTWAKKDWIFNVDLITFPWVSKDDLDGITDDSQWMVTDHVTTPPYPSDMKTVDNGQGVWNADFEMVGATYNEIDNTYDLTVDLSRKNLGSYGMVFPKVLYDPNDSGNYNGARDINSNYGNGLSGTIFVMADTSSYSSKNLSSRGYTLEANYDGRVYDSMDEPGAPPSSSNAEPNGKYYWVTDRYTIKGLPIGEDVLLSTWDASSARGNESHRRDRMYALNPQIRTDATGVTNGIDYYGYYGSSWNANRRYVPINIKKDIEFVEEPTYSVGGTGASMMFESYYMYEKFDPLDSATLADDTYRANVKSEYKLISDENLIIEVTPASGGETITASVETKFPKVSTNKETGYTTIERQDVYASVDGLEMNTTYDVTATYDSDFEDIVYESSFTTGETLSVDISGAQVIPNEEEPSKATINIDIDVLDDGTGSFDPINVSLREGQYGLLEDIADIRYLEQISGTAGNDGVYSYELSGLEGGTTYESGDIIIDIPDIQVIGGKIPNITTAPKHYGDTPVSASITQDKEYTTSSSVDLNYEYSFASDDDLYYFLEHNLTKVDEIVIYDVSTLEAVNNKKVLGSTQPYNNTGGRSGSIVIDELDPETEYKVKLGVRYTQEGNVPTMGTDMDGNEIITDWNYSSEKGEYLSQTITIKTSVWTLSDLNWTMIIIVTVLVLFTVGMIIVGVLYYRSHH